MNTFKVPLPIIRLSILTLFVFLMGVAGSSNLVVSICTLVFIALMVSTYISYTIKKMKEE